MFRYFLFAVALGCPVLGVLSEVQPRIFLGNDTNIEDWSYVVSVQLYGRHICGGSIISPRWIVTAAHCFKFPTIFLNSHLGLNVYTIRAGSTYHDEGGEVIYFKNIIINKCYNRFNLDCDIALIRLRNVITTPSAKPIKIAVENELPEIGDAATVAGWGDIREGGPMSRQLKSIDIVVLSLDDCRSFHDWFGLFVTNRMLCGGGLNGYGIPCSGDSGGPLVVNGVLTGIVSKGFPCELPSKPVLYTSISHFSSWIRENADI